MSEQVLAVDLVDAETSKNKKKIRCEQCNSFILQSLTGVYTKLDTPVDVPTMRQKKDLVNQEFQVEKMSEFWLVNNMLTFENIGFTNSVTNMKYLICADCEIGPIGFQNLDKPNEFYVCLNRVKHA